MATGVADDEDGGVGFDEATMRMLSVNLPDNIFRNPDPRVQMAGLEAARTQRITPVLKEELRLRILTKRMARGEPELETDHTPKTYELTEEEKEKRERRKEQNRVAARKCRERRKMKNLDLAEKYDNARDQNSTLLKEIDELSKKQRLMEKFCNDHILSGCCQVNKTLSYTLATPSQRSNSSSSNSNNNTSTDGCSDASNNIDSKNKSSNNNVDNSSRSSSNTISKSPTIIVSSQTLPISPLMPLSPNSPNLSLPPTSPNSISPELFSPNFGHTTVDVSGKSTVWLTNLTSGVQTPTLRSTSPKSSGGYTAMPRPLVSRASSTASLPPPPSPCHLNQSSSSLTLTPPPSVSSEFNIVPESPSYFTNMSGFEQNDLSVRLASDNLMADMNLGRYNTQLSPDESISNSSTNINMIIRPDKMFDDDDDDYESRQKDIISAVVPWDKLQ